MPLRVLLADDHPIVEHGVRAVLEPLDFKIVARIDSANEILSAIETYQPNVLIMEVRMANADALKILESLPDDFEVNQVVVFSSHSHRSHLARASALGCHDFVEKTSDSSVLIDAVQRSAAGEETPETSLLKITRARMRQAGDTDEAEHSLTGRELQVLRHVSMGLSNREVGKALGISVETVKEHVQNILRKLSVNDRTQAAVWAVRGGFI